MRSALPRTMLCLASLLLATTAWSDDWPQWRGPDGQGVSQARDVPLRWSETDNVAWKTTIRGRGWSSPVVLESQIWLTTAETIAASDDDVKQRREASTNTQPLQIVEQVQLRAIGLDRETGQIEHDVLVMTDDRPDPIHASNSYATPTPILESGRLYTYFGTHGAAAVDTTTGEVLWTNQTLRLNHENGPGSSPVLHQDLLILHCDGSDVQYVAALDKHSGQLRWKSERSGQMHANPQLRKAYATPLGVHVQGQEWLISPAADWLYAYDPMTGDERWKFPYGALGFSNVSRPVYANGLVYICTGFMKSRLLAFDVTSGKTPPPVVWSLEKQAPTVTSPLVVNGLVFAISDGGIATCLDAQTGNVHWQKRVGGNHWSSPLYVDGHVIFSDQDGRSTVVRAASEYELVATNQLDGAILASLAAVDDVILARTEHALYSLKKR